MSAPIGILYVDDNTSLAESIRVLIDAASDLKWLGHLPSAEHLAAEVAATSPQIVLLDISMPGPHPLETLEAMVSAGSQVRAIVVSGYVDSDYVMQAMDAGAWGYVGKHESPDAIFDAIRRVARGDVVFPGQPSIAPCRGDEERN